MADVEQTQKMIPFITCEISLCQYVSELVFGCQCIYFDLDLWCPNLFFRNNRSRATLWVLETCLMVGLLPFLYHLDHCFVVFKDFQQSFLTRRMHLRGNKINIVQIINHSMRFLSRWKFVRSCTNWVRARVSPLLITLIRVS